MSKNAEGWVRHSSKQQPVDDHVEVEIRTRGGDYEICEASGFAWNATGEDQIMAYRLHKPVEQVEACSKPDPRDSAKRDSDYVCWMRDRITEIDRTVEALEEERVSLVQRLEDEGFRLIERVNAGLSDAMQAHEDMSDWRNWKAGDLLTLAGRVTDTDFTEGKQYKFLFIDEWDEVVVIDDAGDENGYYVNSGMFKFHSRPSA